MTQFEDKLSGDTLNWQGQSEQGTDHLIINHQSLALEILVFYRKHKREHAHGAFVYEGVFEYQSHEAGSKPTNFVLTRKSSHGFSLAADSLPALVPSGTINTITLSYFVGASEQCAPLYFFLSIFSLLRTHGASSLNFVPSPWLTGNIFSNLFVASRDHGVKFDKDQALEAGLLHFSELEKTTEDPELNISIENYARRFGCAELKSISALVLQKFLEPFGTAPTATQKQIFTDAEDTFAEAIVPFRLSESDLFLQVHPLWISYFQDNLPTLTELFLTKLCELSATSNNNKEDVLTKLFYSDRAILLSCLSSTPPKQPSLESKTDQIESLEEEDDDKGEAPERGQNGEQGEEEEQREQKQQEVQIVPLLDLPKKSTEANQLLLPFKASATIETSQLTLPIIRTQEPNPGNISLNCSSFMSAVAKLPPISQLYFLSLLRCLEQQSDESETVPQSILGEKLYTSLWLLSRRGLQVGATDLINDLQELKERPDANWRLYNQGFVAELKRAIRNRLSHEHLKKVQKLGTDFNLILASQSNATSQDISQLGLAVHQSHVSICDKNWLHYIHTELASLKVWTATQLCLSLAPLNPRSSAIHRTIFALQTDLRDAVAQKLSELEKSTNQSIVTSEGDDHRASAATPLYTPQTNVQSLEKKQAELLHTSGVTEIELSTVAKLFTNTTNSYKFLFVLAVTSLTNGSDLEEPELDFKSLLVELLVIAAKLVCLNSNINFGSQDKILEDLAILNVRPQKYATNWTSYKENNVRGQAITHENDLNQDLLRYAPYLLIRPFIEDQIPKNLSGEQLHEKIAELSIECFSSHGLLYSINKKRKVLTVHRTWAKFLRQNLNAVSSLVNEEFAQYLKKRNPHLEEIEFGLRPNPRDPFAIKSIEQDHQEEGLEKQEQAQEKHEASQNETAAMARNGLDFTEQRSEQRNFALTIGFQTAGSTATQQSNQSIAVIESRHDSSEQVAFKTSGNGQEQTDALTNIWPTDGSLFSGFSPTDGAAAVQYAFKRIVEKLSEKEAPRSLCQLEINNSDYLWLTTWLKLLDLGTASHFLKDRCYARISSDSQYTNQQAIGCLFLLSCSEINRREGQEGSIWPLFFVSVDTSLNPIILSHIFDGSASSAVTEAFRAAIQVLKLRNVMNTEDHSQFLITTFLQFGFSRYGIRHLPTWLRSQNWTESVRNLLNENSPNRSETFCQLWESCRRFLDRRMSVDDLRHELINSSWILPDWHDDIIRVLANPDDRFSLPVPGTGRHLRFESVPPVTAKFIWNPPEKPLFTIAFAFERLGLEEGQVYTVQVDDSPYLLNQPSEYLWRLSAQVKLPLERNEVSIEILAEDKSSIFSSTLMLWRQDDVQIFDILSGRLLNEQPSLKTDRTYAILASADLKLEPQPSHKLSLPRMGRELYLLQPGWPSDTRVMLDDETLWAADNNAEAPYEIEQQLAVTAVLERRSLAPGEPIKIVFRGENSDTRVEALRVSGISVPIVWNGERTETQEAIDLGSDALRGNVDLTVKVRHQNNLRVRRQKLAVSLTGCASWNGIAWTTLSEDSILTLDECKRNQFYFRYKPLDNADYADYAIFEGNTLRSRLSSDRMSISELSASGGVLEIRKIFNAGVDAPRIIIARGVTDPGIVAAVSDINASEMRLELKEARELSEKHQIIIWPDDSKPIFLSPADMRKVNDRTWDFVPCTASTNIAVALAYDGILLGASWAPDTRTFLERIQYRMEPVEIAALLAWMRWPLLLKENLSAARMFAKHHPHETLSAWLNENGLDPNLKTDGLSATESWHSVTRQIFAFWSPTKETILQLTNTLTNENEQFLDADSIVLAAKRLWFSCPELMAKYLHVAFNNCSDQTQVPINRRKILESIEEAILAGATGNTMRRADLFSQCADEFDVDPKFLTDQSEEAVTLLFKTRIETSQDTINRNNLFLLQSKLKGRQVLSLAIINYFKQTPR